MLFYNTNAPFQLESGAILENLTIAYNTYGQLNENKSNVIWICHALTANSDVSDWWSGIVGVGKFYDPNDYFIVCANVIGSAYGTTGPLIPQLNQRPLLDNFPTITIRDMVHAHQLLCNRLGVRSIHTLLGASVGGQQALEWAILDDDLIQSLVLIATNAQHSAYGIAFNESQRLAILADATYGNGTIKGGRAGLIAARSIALLSYRSYKGYNETQTDTEDSKLKNYKAASYQKYQGEKLANRFNAYSYVTLINAMDSHNVARNRGELADVLKGVKAKTITIGIDSDVLFPTNEQKLLADLIPNAYYEEITSDFGHDGFLIETDQLTLILNRFYTGESTSEFPKFLAINYN